MIAREYNKRCQPPFSEEEIVHKMNGAFQKPITRMLGETRGGSSWSNKQAIEQSREMARIEREAREREAAGAKSEGRKAMEKIMQDCAWDVASAWDDSPLRIDDKTAVNPFWQTRLLPSEGFFWHGDNLYQGSFKTGAQLTTEAKEGNLRGRVSLSAFKRDAENRKAENIQSRPFILIESDKLFSTGLEPSTPEEKDALIRESLARVRFMRERLGWDLKWIAHTGGKSVHSVFSADGVDLADLGAVGERIGIDCSPVKNATSTTRWAGTRHEKTGGKAKLLWCGMPRGCFRGDGIS